MWYERSLCGLPVMLSRITCGLVLRSALVVQHNEGCRWPNKPLELTPLRVDEIGAFLEVSITQMLFRLIAAAQLSGKALGHHHLDSAWLRPSASLLVTPG
jgi:hypothetical protein